MATLCRMETDLLDYVRRKLQENRGKWPAIAVKADVPYDTITKIAQGQIKDPGVSKVQRLANHFRGLEATA